MYGILAAGKPILALAAAETDVAAIGREQGFSVAADPDSPARLAAAVRELMRDPQKLGNMGAAARAAAPGYDRVTELQKFVRILEEATET